MSERHLRAARPRQRRFACLLACGLSAAGVAAVAPGALAAGAALVGPSVSAAGGPGSPGSPPVGHPQATLQECVTAVSQAERSATFGGEMSAIPGLAHMSMRIDVLERLPGETAFRVISAPGLGVWRAAASGVKDFKYLDRVVNLTAPAFYRASVHFRWLTARGHVVRVAERRTSACEQPAPPPTVVPQQPAAGG